MAEDLTAPTEEALKMLKIKTGGPDEAAYLYNKWKHDPSPHHRAAFAGVLMDPTATAADLYWTLSEFDPQKGPALAAIDDLRGQGSGDKTGVKCPACGARAGTIRTVQTRSGDEAPSVQIVCRSCGKATTIG